MSGGGGGGYYPSDESLDCVRVSILTQLASPVTVVINTLKVGDELLVKLSPPAGPVEVVTTAGKVAGALLPPAIAELINCMLKGFKYKATIREIKGGNCQVLISNQ